MASTRAARERRRRETGWGTTTQSTSLWSDSERRAARVMTGARHLETDSDSDATPVARRRRPPAEAQPPSPAEEHAALSAELARLQDRLTARAAAHGSDAAAAGSGGSGADSSGRPAGPRRDDAAELLAEARRLTDELSSGKSPPRSEDDAMLGQKLRDANRTLAESHHNQRQSRDGGGSQHGSSPPAPGDPGRLAEREAVELRARLADAEQRESQLAEEARRQQAQVQSWAERLDSSERARVEAEAEAEAWKVASLEAEAKAEAWKTASLAAEDAAHAAAAAQAEAEEENLQARISELQEQNSQLLSEALAHAEQLERSEAKLREEAAARDEEVAAMRDAMRAAQALSDGADVATTELANTESERARLAGALADADAENARLQSDMAGVELERGRLATESEGLTLAVNAATEMATKEREARLKIQAEATRSAEMSERVAALEAKLTAAGVARATLEQRSATAEEQVVDLRATCSRLEQELSSGTAHLQAVEQQRSQLQQALSGSQLQLKETLDPMKLDYVKTQERVLELEEQLEVERRQAEGAVIAAAQTAREAAMADAAAELQMLAQRVQELSATCLELEESRRGHHRHQPVASAPAPSVAPRGAAAQQELVAAPRASGQPEKTTQQPAANPDAALHRRMIGAGRRLYGDGLPFAAIRRALIQEHDEEAWAHVEDELREITGEPQVPAPLPGAESEESAAMQQAVVQLSQRFPQCSSKQIMATVRKTGGNAAQAREVLRVRGYEEMELEQEQEQEQVAAAPAAAAPPPPRDRHAKAQPASPEPAPAATAPVAEPAQPASSAIETDADAEASLRAQVWRDPAALEPGGAELTLQASVASHSEDPFAPSERVLAAAASPRPTEEDEEEDSDDRSPQNRSPPRSPTTPPKPEPEPEPEPEPTAASPSLNSSPARVKLAKLTVDGSMVDGMLVAGFGAETASMVDCVAAWALPRMAESDLTNGATLRGKVALVDRGGVPAVDKARRVQAAGAIACAIVNSNDKAWRPGGHMPAGAALADVGADILIPVIVVPRSTAAVFGDGGGLLSLEYGKADTPSMNAKALFKSAGRALALRNATSTAGGKSPPAEGERKLPLAFGDETRRGYV
jgi:hypothetical protein